MRLLLLTVANLILATTLISRAGARADDHTLVLYDDIANLAFTVELLGETYNDWAGRPPPSGDGDPTADGDPADDANPDGGNGRDRDRRGNRSGLADDTNPGQGNGRDNSNNPGTLNPNRRGR